MVGRGVTKCKQYLEKKIGSDQLADQVGRDLQVLEKILVLTLRKTDTLEDYEQRGKTIRFLF